MRENEHLGRPELPARSAVPEPSSAASGADAAGEASALARHGDPSRQRPARNRNAADLLKGRGAAWVRPTELLSGLGGRTAGLGISLQAELSRRTRRLPVTAVTGTRKAVARKVASRRARRLPPVTAFGVDTPSPSTSRGAIGLR
ncbi:hypothetical protein [Microbacterium lacticum]